MALNDKHVAVDRQVPFGILLQELGGEKSGPRSGGMDGLGLGQGLHTPIALRPPSPMQPSGMGRSPLEGGSSVSRAVVPVAPRMELSISGAPAPGNELPLKRKRGRPRKYTGDSSPANASGVGNTESLFSALAKKIAAPYTPPPDKSEKRGRGRPLGSTKKQQLANLGEDLNHYLKDISLSKIFRCLLSRRDCEHFQDVRSFSFAKDSSLHLI